MSADIFCNDCKIYCSGEENYILHINGSRHVKRIEFLRLKDSLEIQTDYYCKDCDLFCSSQNCLENHYKGKTHLKKIKTLSLIIPNYQLSLTQTECNEIENNEIVSKELVLKNIKNDNCEKVLKNKTYEIIKAKNDLDSTEKDVEEFIEKYFEIKNITSEKEDLNQNYMKKHKSNNYELNESSDEIEKAAENNKNLSSEINKNILEENTSNINYNVISLNIKTIDVNQLEKFQSDLPILNSNNNLKNRELELGNKNDLNNLKTDDLTLKNNNNELEIPITKCSIGFTETEKLIKIEPNDEDQLKSLRKEDCFKQETEEKKKSLNNKINLNKIEFKSSSKMNKNQTKYDKYIIIKLNEITYSDEELLIINTHIKYVENILKTLSEKIQYNASNELGKQKIFKKCSRIGNFRKSIFLKKEKKTDLVLICSIEPNLVFHEFIKSFSKELKLLNKNESFDLRANLNELFFDVVIKSYGFIIRINFAFFNDESIDKKALEYFEDNKRFLWFKEKIYPNENYLIVLKILRDFTLNNMAWKPLTCYVLELICERVMSNHPAESSPFEILKHILKAIASGVLLPDKEIALLDPCKDEKIDALGYLSDDEKIQITESARDYINLITFFKLHKVLKIDCINDELLF